VPTAARARARAPGPNSKWTSFISRTLLSATGDQGLCSRGHRRLLIDPPQGFALIPRAHRHLVERASAHGATPPHWPHHHCSPSPQPCSSSTSLGRERTPSRR
jgi:hypothetical protein